VTGFVVEEARQGFDLLRSFADVDADGDVSVMMLPK
jgi:hypothetical protein